MDYNESDLTKTTLTVTDGETTYPVYVTQGGRFVVIRVAADDSRDAITKDTFAELMRTFDSLEKKARRSKDAGRPIAVLYDGGVVHGRIFGMADGSSRVLQKGFGEARVNKYDKAYVPFSDVEEAEYKRLLAGVSEAKHAVEAFLEPRSLGAVRDVLDQMAEETNGSH